MSQEIDNECGILIPNGISVIKKKEERPVIIQEAITVSSEHDKVNINMSEELKKISDNINKLRIDVDKLKSQMTEKVPKTVLVELESKILNHTKVLDTTSSKLFELQKNLKEFINQPVSHTLMETLRKQLTDEITGNVKKMIESSSSAIMTIIDEKQLEIRELVNKAKRVMFSK